MNSDDLLQDKDFEAGITRLLHTIFEEYGYDFLDYAKASQKRRIRQVLAKHKLANMDQLEKKVRHDRTFFFSLLNELTITVTEFFRDPDFFKAIRERVVPYLRTYPQIKIWDAGCASGKETYSLAILLKEEGLLDKCLIYATDINLYALEKAKKGIVTTSCLKEGTRNYFEAGGKRSICNYWTIKHDFALLDKSLLTNVVFSDHNLATDRSFGEMQLVLCRNVLIYFNRNLQERVLGLLTESTCRGGFLCLGSKESLFLSAYKERYTVFDRNQKIFQKKSILN